MIQWKVLEQNYPCRTRDRLWYREIKKAISLMVKDHKTLEEIRILSQKSNIFNASSASRAKELQAVVGRRISAVDDSFLTFFQKSNTETQLQLCIVMVMLTDRSFLEFMDSVFREKLIKNDLILKDSDLIGFFHNLQDKDERASKWTDAGIKKTRDNYKSMLKEAGMLSESGIERQIIRPLISPEAEDFLKEEGLERICKILTGERE